MATTTGLSLQNMNLVRRAQENIIKPGKEQTFVAGMKQRRALSNRENQVFRGLKETVPFTKPEKQLTKNKGYSDLRSHISKQVEEKAIQNEAKDTHDIFSDMVCTMGQTLPVVEDVDKDDLGQPMLSAEYVKDIYKYLLSLEAKLRVSDYMHIQSEINEKMRSILVDWLIQVHHRFGLLQETLYLTIYILDRFLAKVVVQRSKLQLAGVSAMLLASKYEETFAPEIADFVYITDNAYTKADIRSMERDIHSALDYDLSHPLCLHFLRRNSKVAKANAKQHTLAKYFMELTLTDYDAARLLPSQIAASASCLSSMILGEGEWSALLEYYSGYSLEQITPHIKKMACLVKKAETSKLQAVRSKYSGSKFMKISKIPELKTDKLNSLIE